MDNLTVKQAKDLGVVFVDGDIGNNFAVVDSDWFNDCSCHSGDKLVEKFAWRTNTGEKPAGDFMVEVRSIYGSVIVSSLNDINWNGSIFEWRPHLPSLIESANKKNAEDEIKIGNEIKIGDRFVMMCDGTTPEMQKWKEGDDLEVIGFVDFGYGWPYERTPVCLNINRTLVSSVGPNVMERPLTPEQKAAKERKKAIEEMCELVKLTYVTAGDFDVCSKLYDAGYRKESK